MSRVKRPIQCLYNRSGNFVLGLDASSHREEEAESREGLGGGREMEMEKEKTEPPVERTKRDSVSRFERVEARS